MDSDDDVAPMDDIDKFHSKRDKIYLDSYKRSIHVKKKVNEFMPLSSGNVWSDGEEEDYAEECAEDNYEEEENLTAAHKAILKQEQLAKFKKSMGSDMEDTSESEDEAGSDAGEDEDEATTAAKATKGKEKSTAWGGKKRQYYGGEEENLNMESDDESMALEECRKLRSDLHLATNKHHPLVKAMAPDTFDLVYASGASRLPLLLTSSNHPTEEAEGIEGSNKHESDQKPITVTNTETEAEAYLKHSIAVFATPDSWTESRPDKMKEYLRVHYPDMFYHYCEYLKVRHWLDTVWDPLFSAYVETEKIKMDSIAGQYIGQRKTRLEVEKEGLSLYYRMRQEQKPMMRYHPIHNALKEMAEERKSFSVQDQAFVTLAGSVLLKNIHSDKTFHQMAKDLPGKDEFLRCLHSAEADEKYEKLIDSTKAVNKKVGDKTKVEMKAKKIAANGSDDSDNEIVSDLDDEAEWNEDERRPITYEISKNKGLTAYRKKRDRNPRVKLRHKYKKALVRRKSQVPNVRREEKAYAGEVFGIRACKVKSRRLH